MPLRSAEKSLFLEALSQSLMMGGEAGKSTIGISHESRCLLVRGEGVQRDGKSAKFRSPRVIILDVVIRDAFVDLDNLVLCTI
jgi:hypothetical protein